MLSTYRIISWTYLAVPVAAGLLVIWSYRRRKSLAPMWSLLRLLPLGLLLGIGIAGAYSMLGGARVRVGQVVLACYGALSVLIILRSFNAATTWGAVRLFRIDPKTGDGCCVGAQIFAGLAQAIVVLGIGIPYLLSLGIIYRPKAVQTQDPGTLLGVPFEVVHLSATDGVPLEGWWIPAAQNARTDHRGSVRWGQNTVILCPGFGADKATQLFLVHDLVPNGFNVLALDLRAHGNSGGSFTSFGDLERRDVLGAVRWVKTHHLEQSRKVLGLGESLGAAALIAAAADQGPDGQAIDAIAVYNPFDELEAVAERMAHTHVIGPAEWVATRLALPMAGAQLGTDLRAFAPAREAAKLWPRPILVIGTRPMRLSGDDRSQELFDAALQPKYLFRLNKDREAVLHDDQASLAVRIFFSEEQSIL